jgi:hypothetical protein
MDFLLNDATRHNQNDSRPLADEQTYDVDSNFTLAHLSSSSSPTLIVRPMASKSEQQVERAAHQAQLLALARLPRAAMRGLIVYLVVQLIITGFVFVYANYYFIPIGMYMAAALMGLIALIGPWNSSIESPRLMKISKFVLESLLWIARQVWSVLEYVFYCQYVRSCKRCIRCKCTCCQNDNDDEARQRRRFDSRASQFEGNNDEEEEAEEARIEEANRVASSRSGDDDAFDVAKIHPRYRFDSSSSTSPQVDLLTSTASSSPSSSSSHPSGVEVSALAHPIQNTPDGTTLSFLAPQLFEALAISKQQH